MDANSKLQAFQSVVINSSAMNMTNSTSVPTSSTMDTFNNLYPALLQCFTVILIGYCTGRMGLITPTSSKGIGVFISHVSLPALLFKSMAGLDFSAVNWLFLASILIAKTVVFITVAVFTLVLVRPTNYGKAGLFAIFATQSNDLALGYPLLVAIFNKTYPELVNYIYLMAPISLLFLTPIGFILMEVQKQRTSHQSLSTGTIAVSTVKGMIKNPIVFMTFIGIIGDFIFNHNLPVVLKDILDALGSAFFGTALFYLGLKMVGNMKKKMGFGLLVPFLLVMAKTLFVPLVAWELIEVLGVGKNSSIDTNIWSMFGFIYGTFPTAPSVVIFAAKFGLDEENMASSMVLCTFLSAPLMFLSAQMSLLRYTNKVDIDFFNVLKNTMIDLGSIGIPTGVWVIVVLVLSRRYQKLPHRFTLFLVCCQLLICLSSVLSLVQLTHKAWFVSLTLMFCVGCWGSRCWTAMVAVSLFLVRCKGDGAIKKWRIPMHVFGWGVPILSCAITIGLVNFDDPKIKSYQPSFIYYTMVQEPVTVITILVLCACMVIVSLSIVKLRQRDRYCTCSNKRAACEQSEQHEAKTCDAAAGDSERCFRCVERDQQSTEQCSQSCPDDGGGRSLSVCASAERPKVIDIEDLNESTCLLSNADDSRRHSVQAEEEGSVQKLELKLTLEEYYRGDRHQPGRHIVMLILLQLSMFFGLFLCLWAVLKENTQSGIFIALRTVDVFLLFGQCFIVFACFGMERQLIIVPFVKRWRKFWYGVEEIKLASVEDLDPEVRHLCDQFKRYHKRRCRQEIVRDQRHRFRKYKSVFRGDKLVSWLLDVGLASDRQAAVHYGNCLLSGRIIHHVTDEHFFYDSPYFYQFGESQ